MKKNIFLLVIFSFFVALGAREEILANKKNKVNSAVNSKKIQEVTSPDLNKSNINTNEKTDSLDILPDREISFDLEKLSKMASLSIYGDKSHRANGLVVLKITIDENCIPERISVVDSEDSRLNLPAIKIIKEYIKKYKVQAAVKNGRPVRTEELLVPVLFDMSLFD